MKKRPKKVSRLNEDDDVNFNHRQRKLKYLKARRDLRRAEIMMARWRSIARFFAILLVFFSLYKIVNLPQWYLNPDVFLYYPNNHLEIQGNQIVSNAQIMKELAKVHLPNKPIYLLNTRPIEKTMFNLAPVKKVYIRRYWFPARLKIVIDEKIPVLAISPTPKISPIAVFTDDSSIIGKNFLPLPSSLRAFNILTYDDYTKWSSKHVKYLLYLSNLIESASNEKLEYLDIRNPQDIFAQLDNIRLRLGDLGGTAIFTRTKRISPLLPEALKIKDQIDYVDLRWDRSVSIKLKSKAQRAAVKASPKQDKPPAKTAAEA